MAYFLVLSHHLFGYTKENHEKPQLHLASWSVTQ